jgi:hypothetical protein
MASDFDPVQAVIRLETLDALKSRTHTPSPEHGRKHFRQ